MIDLGLIPLAEKAISAKPRRYITPAILLAVCQQESLGVPYWIDTKPGSLFSLNVNDAIEYRKKIWIDRKKGLYRIEKRKTGLTREDIIKAITIPQSIDKFIVEKQLSGKLAKFRFEPGYWERYSKPGPNYIENKIDRFIYSCSWGMVQFMGFNISPKHDAAGIQFIRRFACDLPMQMLYGAGMLEDLLIRTKGDVDRMYRGYNSGDVDCLDPKVVDRAKSVAKFAKEIQVQLDRRKKLHS